MENLYTTNPGDHLVINVISIGTFIGEVVQTSPLIVKAEETGPLSNMRKGAEFKVLANLSSKIQDPVQSKILLEKAKKDGKPYYSSLWSLGVFTGVFEEILFIPKFEK